MRRRDVLTAYPYTNTLTVLRVTGSVLRRAMERSAEYFAVDEEGRLCVADAFLKPKVEHYNYDYFSGVNYAFDVSRPEGQRVVELTYQGKAVKDEDEFTICLNSYRASGAGGYPEYTQCQVVREINIEIYVMLFRNGIILHLHMKNLKPYAAGTSCHTHDPYSNKKSGY